MDTALPTVVFCSLYRNCGGGLIVTIEANDGGNPIRPGTQTRAALDDRPAAWAVPLSGLALAPMAVQADPLDPHSSKFLDGHGDSHANLRAAALDDPLVLVTPRLEQELRFYFNDQQNGTGSRGNGQHYLQLWGTRRHPRRTDARLLYRNNFGGSPTSRIHGAPRVPGARPGRLAGVSCERPLLLAKRGEWQLYPEAAFFQMSSHWVRLEKYKTTFLVAQPTLSAVRFGAISSEMTIGQQYPVAEGPRSSTGATMRNFGDPVLWNTVFQYHFLQYFWPELEVNYEYWPNGELRGSARYC